MQIIDLFSGIGGFSLPGRWAGWHTVQFCETDEFCQKVLSYHFPGVPIHGDIKTLNYETIEKGNWKPGEPTIITGGFPCQPFSFAGKQRGTADNRNLWPEMFRIIREIKPAWIVAENVPALLTIGGELVFSNICADLENEGYEVQPVIIPACAVNAPHRRDRLWIVANRNSGQHKQQENQIQTGRDTINNGIIADTNGSRRLQNNEKQQTKQQPKQDIPDWRQFPTQSPVCSRDDGLPAGLDDITFSKWRRESIKAYGNAIVPQVAYQIFEAINKLCFIA